MMIICWDTDQGDSFIKHANAEVSDDIGLRLLSITRVLKRGERGNEYQGILRFQGEEVQVSFFTADLILDLLRAMGARHA